MPFQAGGAWVLIPPRTPGIWIEEVESGSTASEVTINQWVNLVWATQEHFPDERRLVDSGGYRWVASDLLSAAEVIVQHHLDVVEQQDMPEQEP